MKKRLICAALVFALLLGLTACGGAGTVTVDSGAAAPATQGTTKPEAPETTPGTTAQPEPQEPAEDPNEVVYIETSYDEILMVTRGGDAYYMDKDHPDAPWLAASNVKSAEISYDGIDYIDNDNKFFSNDVNYQKGGVFENEMRFENVDQVVTSGPFSIYLDPDGKVYIDKTSAGYISSSDDIYGGTKQLHDHELVAENGKDVLLVMMKGAYLNANGELWCLEDEEWRLIADNVASVCKTEAIVPMVLKRDGTVMWTKGPDDSAAFDENVDEIYVNTRMYRKGDRFCLLRTNYYASSTSTYNIFMVNNIKTPIRQFGDLLIYIGTDDQIHCTKYTVEYDSDGIGRCNLYYDKAYPLSVDSMKEIYTFLLTEDEIKPEN